MGKCRIGANIKFSSPRYKQTNFLCVQLHRKEKPEKLLEMPSFKEAREMLLLNHDMKTINDKNLLLLLDDNITKNNEFK